MKKCCCYYIGLQLVIGLGLCNTGHTQPAAEDALQFKQEALSSRPDKKTIDKAINHALEYLNTDLDTAQRALLQTLKESLEIEYATGIAASYTNLGYIEVQQGDYIKAIQLYNSAKPYLDKAFHNRTSIAMYYSSYAAPYFYLSKFDSVYHYADKALLYIDTLRHLNEAEANDVISVYNNFALLWDAIGNQDKALRMLNKAKNISERFKNKGRLLQFTTDLVYINLGKVFNEKNEPDTAIFYLSKVLQSGSNTALSALYMADGLVQKQDTAAATRYLQNAIAISSSLKTSGITIQAKLLLGTLYFDQHNYEQAIPLLKEVADYCNAYPERAPDKAYSAFDLLASDAARNGRLREAYDLEAKSRSFLEKLKLQEQQQAIYSQEATKIEARLKLESEASRLRVEQAENKVTNRNLGIAAILFLMLGLVAWIVYAVKNNRRKMDQRQVQQEHELAIIRLQSVLKGEEQERNRLAREIHDGILIQFATLKNQLIYIPDEWQVVAVKEYMASSHFKEIVSQMEETSKEMRLTAHNLMPEFLLESGLGEALFYFCNTTLKQAKIDLEFQWHGPELDLKKEDMRSVFRIVQELIQNIIKHAAAKQVLVQVSNTNNNTFSITIEDDGKGFDILHKGRGIGLQNIKSRLQLLGGTMDVKSSIGKGCSVYIEIETLSLLQN